ncbi:ArgE/DapE family deacylase [Streptomyces sp. 769]|uniref:ArgE/DapE family deacylase n=1 Tax=Streptomyces sp. 769 TaxID=1262452 RepID=UPI00057E1FFE|nr:ArgE/DapE family deacylase [Streptomyces sp. 769]AJC60737.1 peptidase dimerization domain-containing protein [Streptomyces sp. 769]
MSAVLSAEERAALEEIDETSLARMLMELLAIPSVTGSAAESEMQHRLAGQLDRLGLDVDLWPVDLPALRAHPDFPGIEAPRDEAWGLVAATPGGGDGPTMILQGHVDVVPPGDLRKWDGDPFVPRVAGNVVHGRGACDMKAGLVANLAALAAIRASGARLRGRVAAHFVVGEEDGGLGAFATLQRGHTGDACLITEPTGGTLVTANAGALTFRIEVPGQATHASTRDAGVSAIDAYVPIHQALARLEARRNTATDPLMAEYATPYALSVGTLRAGDWASSVPDRLVAEGRLGVALGEDPAEAVADFETCVAQTCAQDPWLRDHPAIVTWPGGRFASGRLPAGHPLGALVRDAHADAVGGPRVRERGAPYGSDLRLYTAADIPTLQFGPGDVRLAHSAREQVSVPEIAAVARTLVLAALRTVGTR